MTVSEAPDENARATDRDSPAEVVDRIDRPVLLFDGVCNLCHASIRAIVRLDAAGKILFAPLQSEVGRELLDRQGLSPDYFDSVVLVEGDSHYTKSTAVLRACRCLDGPLPLVYPLVYLPRGLRDAVYDFVAEHRYGVFGKRDECSVPEPHVRERFLERSLA
ncbi:MAG: thiol-disulfide oxidoreductase DCC family protein [Halobacteriales archaeon SW_9_67_25]|jgi:predicted DCC family thiol-disulfide oxidoreductase YuxK|nr:MAG: thiol-disulfide oxidoreductase DCC family protein [Halobacteriales archaeon SW_9_67_25]